MESPVNNSSERCFQANQIWHELFPEPKTMLMSELEDLIDKIGEVCYYKNFRFTLIENCSKIAVWYRDYQPKAWGLKKYEKYCRSWSKNEITYFYHAHRGWSPKYETGINIIIKSALYSIFWQNSITNIKINSFQIFWKLFNPFYWEYTKDLLRVYWGNIWTILEL